MTSSRPSDAAPTATVVRSACGISLIVLHSSSAYEVSVTVTPSSAWDWSITMPIANPSTKPDMTALDRNVDTHPMRSSPRAT
jgi:hypothetical protein